MNYTFNVMFFQVWKENFFPELKEKLIKKFTITSRPKMGVSDNTKLSHSKTFYVIFITSYQTYYINFYNLSRSIFCIPSIDNTFGKFNRFLALCVPKDIPRIGPMEIKLRLQIFVAVFIDYFCQIQNNNITTIIIFIHYQTTSSQSILPIHVSPLVDPAAARVNVTFDPLKVFRLS